MQIRHRISKGKRHRGQNVGEARHTFPGVPSLESQRVAHSSSSNSVWQRMASEAHPRVGARDFIGSHMDTREPPDLSHSDSSPSLRAIKAFSHKLHSSYTLVWPKWYRLAQSLKTYKNLSGTIFLRLQGFLLGTDQKPVLKRGLCLECTRSESCKLAELILVCPSVETIFSLWRRRGPSKQGSFSCLCTIIFHWYQLSTTCRDENSSHWIRIGSHWKCSSLVQPRGGKPWALWSSKSAEVLLLQWSSLSKFMQNTVEQDINSQNYGFSTLWFSVL